ncbi:hypothetical protein RJ640_007326 [Escallonia rubra]|uniref:Uncharacterized protein n=1 Tax=Escallonia rubra TaxID=112253 RepID=A0AA88R4M0_9ASTE|nr:hypothetical protein RJ640_007326 [Escallonia rubra]
MASSSQQQPSTESSQSLKLAIAMALFKSKLLQKPAAADPPPSSSVDAHKWKQKEILRLKQDLKEAEGHSLSSSSSLSACVDGVQYDLFPKTASCKCYFFDNLGRLSPSRFNDGGGRRFNDVLRRRFLRQVEEYNGEDEMEQLRASVDFLVELCDTVSSPRVDGSNFANWSHQAVDFILGSESTPLLEHEDPHQGLSRPVTDQRQEKPVEGEHSGQSSSPDPGPGPVPVPGPGRDFPTSTTSSGLPNDDFDNDVQLYVQHLIRKLGSEPFIGQRVILSVSQRIAELAESFLFMDPFDEAFPDMHNCMHMMIQLIEFLASDYLVAWSSAERFDTRLFEEWVTSLPHARKALELLESRNGLYVLYMDRVIGEVTKLVGQVSSLHRLNPVIFDSLIR